MRYLLILNDDEILKQAKTDTPLNNLQLVLSIVVCTPY